ncbi:MAG TPA: hypothetical protein DCR35_20995, partial [Runella sp.]|nr:hypothetical protein [Runella sp.]
MGTGNYIEFNSTSSGEYKAYCEEPGKKASDPASQSLGNSISNRTSPVIRAMYSKGTHSDGYQVFNQEYVFSAGKTVYLEQGNCYGAISWLKNGVEFSTALMPQITLQNTCDVYELKCTYSDGVQTSTDLFRNAPITITQQPTSQTVLGGTGASVTLSVRAKNVNSYRWRKNGVDFPLVRGGGLPSDQPDFDIVAVNASDAGNYDVVLTSINACVATVTSDVAVLTVIAGATLTMSNTPVTCNGGNNGTATVTASGGTLPYTYLWSNGQTTSTITGLTSGQYSVTVKDATGTASSAITFVGTPSPFNYFKSTSNVSCKGGNDGAATVSVSNGTAPYTYSWSGGITSTTNSASGLSAGSYTLNVQDNKGCQGSTVVVITEPNAITVTPSKNNISCNGARDGSIVLSTSGGKSPYSYSWNNGITSTTNSALGLGPGTYTVTVKDANNCTKSISVDIIEPDGMTLTPSSTPAKCKGGNDGTATVSVSGGTAPYTYSWSGGITSTANTATGLTAGSYTVTVKDA